MTVPIDSLLAGLARAEGDTVLERVNYLIGRGEIFPENAGGAQMLARSFDHEITIMFGHVTNANNNLKASHLAERLRGAGISKTAREVLENLDFWSENMVAEAEAAHHRTRVQSVSKIIRSRQNRPRHT